jgi:prepilin-type N-terminal cleavage/methylation domain-containing protein
MMIIDRIRHERGSARSRARGFTLVELMVAVSIFAIVMVVAMGAVFSIIAANRKALAVSSVIDNLNLAVESMTRTIKTNTNYQISGNAITVTDDDSLTLPKPTMTYAYDSLNKRIMFREGDEDQIAITAPEVEIDSFEVFKLYDDDAGACDQPRVAIVIRGTAGVDADSRTEFKLQSVVSQRDLQIKATCVI